MSSTVKIRVSRSSLHKKTSFGVNVLVYIFTISLIIYFVYQLNSLEKYISEIKNSDKEMMESLNIQIPTEKNNL